MAIYRSRRPQPSETIGPSGESRSGRAFAPTGRVHGVLMDIYGLGTLIVGESGIGKSESALELIERGHRLVADDIVEIRRNGTALLGRSPDLTRHYMELRGLGVINIKELFGRSSIRPAKRLELVIQLERWESATEVERLGLEESRYPVLDLELPLVRMPVAPGRNLAMLIEVATRNQILKKAGRHAARTLVKKLEKAARRRSAAARRHGLR